MKDFEKWMLLSRNLNTVTVGEWLEAHEQDGVTVIISDGQVRGFMREE